MDSSIQILGNRVDCFESYDELYRTILKNRSAKALSGYITVNNVHTMMEGFRDESYQKIINRSFLSIPDGKPLEIVGKLKGNKKISRLFGPTVMENFIDWGRKDNVRHFFIGSTEENLHKLRKTIDLKYPGAILTGMVSPPYKPLEEWDNQTIVQQINDSKPDFIWVGLGAPKQEKWMYQQHLNINKGIMFGIGAGFDYLTGNTKHAPVWMKNLSLEWAYRLAQEPNRLWKRYISTIPPFLVLASCEVIGIRFRKNPLNDKDVIL
jgi:N-acetylglucosaminyldiphosphoundecaprenol N-acetyl-beta-D-mannosaminyltransferase